MTVSSNPNSHRSQLLREWSSEQDEVRKRQLLLGMVVAGTSLNDEELLKDSLSRCEGILDLEAVEEAILQTLLFAGFPKTIEALKQLRTFYPAGGVETRIEDRKQAGEATSRTVYGDYHPRLVEVMDELHPDLTRWMIEDGYGRVLSRPGLSLQDRELAVLVSLMATGMINQYQAHVRGAHYSGVKAVDIIWFTNMFQCIIAAELREPFERVTRQVLSTQTNRHGE